MRLDVLLIRVVFIAALVVAGYYLRPIGRPATSSAIAAVLAVSIIFFETRIRKASLKTLIGGAVGSILGILGASLIGLVISKQEAIPADFKTFLTIALAMFMGYVGLIVGAVKGDYLDLAAL
ncbi:MAG TPA: PIN domain nuclease, partial [Blastocatellia bacterium]|nr:PIN domain nuclease [Blastocatellia bacterium]